MIKHEMELDVNIYGLPSNPPSSAKAGEGKGRGR